MHISYFEGVLFITQVTGGGNFHQLLAEHTIISEAFLSAATYSWYVKVT